MNNNQQQTREYFADFVKAMLILIVILGHAIQFGSGTEYYEKGLYWENKLVQSMCSFHMPLFMIISGFFHYSSVQRNGGYIPLIKRIKKLLPPLACWAPFFLIGGVVKGSFAFSIKRLLICFITDFWFLWAILFCTLLITCLVYLPQKMRWIICALLIVGMAFSPDSIFVQATYKWLFLFFLLGFLVAKNTICEVPRIRSIIGLGALLIWAVMIYFYDESYFIYTSGWSVLFPAAGYSTSEMVIIDLYRSTMAFYGSISFLWICQLFYEGVIKPYRNSKLCIIVFWIGRKTLPIYMIQMVIFELFMLAITGSFKHNLMINAVETIVVLLITVGFTWILEKNKFTRMVFLGL